MRAGSSEFQKDVVVKTGYVTRRLSTSEAKLWALSSPATTRLTLQQTQRFLPIQRLATTTSGRRLGILLSVFLFHDLRGVHWLRRSFFSYNLCILLGLSVADI